MGTSASINFMSQQEGLISVYDHFDGYPSGMAEKLMAYRNSDSRGLAAAFIRANPRAELVGVNGFTPAGEYTYIVNRRNREETIEAYREYHQPAFFVGTLTEFLERYLPEDHAA